MADTYNPIIGKEKVHRLHPFQHPTPEPGIALVLFREGQPRLTTLWPGDRLTAVKLTAGNYKIIYKVDITEHSFSFYCTLPCEGDAFYFHAEVQVACSVDDPGIIIERNITDVRAVLEPLIIHTMRSISRKQNAEKIGTAERIITKVVKGGKYNVGIKINRVVVKLSLEEEARAHIRRLKQIERDKERERKEAELGKQSDRLKIERMKMKMDFYSPLIKEGQWQLLALRLTNHPEDVPTVIQILNQQRQAEIDRQLRALKIMLEEDALEGFQIEDAGKRILQYLLENIGLELKTQALGSTGERKTLPVGEEQSRAPKLRLCTKNRPHILLDSFRKKRGSCE